MHLLLRTRTLLFLCLLAGTSIVRAGDFGPLPLFPLGGPEFSLWNLIQPRLTPEEDAELARLWETDAVDDLIWPPGLTITTLGEIDDSIIDEIPGIVATGFSLDEAFDAAASSLEAISRAQERDPSYPISVAQMRAIIDAAYDLADFCLENGLDADQILRARRVIMHSVYAIIDFLKSNPLKVARPEILCHWYPLGSGWLVIPMDYVAVESYPNLEELKSLENEAYESYKNYRDAKSLKKLKANAELALLLLAAREKVLPSAPKEDGKS